MSPSSVMIVPTDYCHRHIVAHWFTQNLGVVIREYGQDQSTVCGG